MNSPEKKKGKFRRGGGIFIRHAIKNKSVFNTVSSILDTVGRPPKWLQ